MPTHSEKKILPYSADQMYDLIADVASYPEFLPWCVGARIRERINFPDYEVLEADLIISFKVFRERFGSRVTLRPEARQIDVVYLDGPFKKMDSRWQFTPLENGECEISFFVDFEFKSRTLQAIIGIVFNEAMQRVVGAFEARANVLYGS